MTLTALGTLFVAMVILALLPGPGILVVTGRTTAHGLGAGLWTSAGIVAGDFVFIALALSGLVAMQNHLATLFYALQYLGAAYLIWLGIGLWRAQPAGLTQARRPVSGSHFSSGLLTTLGNPKAILFYASLFPTLLPADTLRAGDVVAILCVAAVSVGGVMAAYCYVAAQLGRALPNARRSRWLQRLASVLLLTSGVWIALRALMQ